jgi:hypothetical protein
MTGMLKNVAWNGIHLSVPPSWELGWIGTRHLFFENHAGPAMEIKWEPVDGRFSHRSHLKKLIAKQKKSPGKRIGEWRLPDSWVNALANFIARGFSWQSHTENGRGAILFCPSCRTALMCQFFNISGHKTDETVLEVLRSLGDHRDDDRTAWTVFDIHALLPRAFHLADYRFKPGVYELAFSGRRQTIKLFRWAPASTFLAQSDLPLFAAHTLGLELEKLVGTSCLEHPAVEWRSTTVAGKNNWFYRFRQKPAYHWVRAWHIVEKNRILGIRLDGGRLLDMNLMTALCANYTITHIT